MDGVELDDAIEAARGLAEMVRDEFPSYNRDEGCPMTLTEIVDTWRPADVTDKQFAAIAKLDRMGVL